MIDESVYEERCPRVMKFKRNRMRNVWNIVKIKHWIQLFLIPSVHLKCSSRLFSCSKWDKKTTLVQVSESMPWIIYKTLVEKTLKDESVRGQNSAVVGCFWTGCLLLSVCLCYTSVCVCVYACCTNGMMAFHLCQSCCWKNVILKW